MHIPSNSELCIYLFKSLEYDINLTTKQFALFGIKMN